MNPTTLKLALNAASSAWGRTKDFREQKSREAYDALSDAAGKVDFDAIRERSGELLDDSRREAGQVTQAARARLEKAREELEERRKNGVADTGKARKTVSRVRRKKGRDVSSKLSSKAARKEAKAGKRRKALGNLGIIALLAAVVAGLYYWLSRRPQPGDTPPRVQDFSGEDSQEQKPTLVYSTTTPEGQKVPAAGDLAEEPAERDEELLGSLDEQLAAHRDTEDAAEDEAPAEDDAAEDEAADEAAEPELVEPEVDPDKTAAQAAAEAEEEITAEAEETKGAEQTAKLGDLQAQAEELEDEMDREIGRNPDENRGA